MMHSASTQLWIGPQERVLASAQGLVQQRYCPAQGCSICYVCKQIIDNQFYALSILSTTKSTYVRSDLDTVFEKISIGRTAEEPFFCIVTQADKLSDASAHSLLKLLEEPPQGWHWILLTDRAHELLPTVISRCVVHTFRDATHESSYHELYRLLTQRTVADIIQFHQILDRTKITEYESRLLLDELITFWTKQSVEAFEYLPVVALFNRYLEAQPMPGSSKIFWRTIYLNFSCLLMV